MTSLRIRAGVGSNEFREELKAASPATRLVITDIHTVVGPGGDSVFRFDIDVEEIVSHSAFDRHCATCGDRFVAKTPKGMYCSSNCRVAGFRKARKEAAALVSDTVATDGGVD